MAARTLLPVFVVASMLLSAQAFAACKYECHARRVDANCNINATKAGVWSKDDPVYIQAGCGTCCDTVPPSCTGLVVAIPSIEIGGVPVDGTLADTGKLCNGISVYKLNNAAAGLVPPGKYKILLSGADTDFFSAGSACTVADDCATVPCAVCDQGFCSQGENYCTSDANCFSGVKCTINATNACMNQCGLPPPPTCSATAPCTGLCQDCVNGTCQQPAKFCMGPNECKDTGESCWQSATADQCISKCGTETSTKSCGGDTDCPWKCASCKGGKCSLPTGFCDSSDDCPVGSGCFYADPKDACSATCKTDNTYCDENNQKNCGCFGCDVAKKKCNTVEVKVPCATDAECPTGKICTGPVGAKACGACTANWECGDGKACKNSGGLPCTNTCVGCSADADCDGCSVCKEGACTPASGCESDMQCGTGKMCSKPKIGCPGTCVCCQCTNDSECDAGLTCFTPNSCGKCAAEGPSCTAAVDCGGGCFSCNDKGKCEKAKDSCTKDSCPTGSLCLLPADPKACQVKQCVVAECIKDEQCQGCNGCSGPPKYTCSVPKVAKCSANSDCKDPAAPYCKVDPKEPCKNVCDKTPCGKDSATKCPACSECGPDGTCGPVIAEGECTVATVATACKKPGQTCVEVQGMPCLNKCVGGETPDVVEPSEDATATSDGDVGKDAADGETVSSDADADVQESELGDVQDTEETPAKTTTAPKKSSCAASPGGTAAWPLLLLAAAALAVLRRRVRA